MDENLKLKFAEQWLRHPDDVLKAALLTVGNTNVGHAMQICANWTDDKIVIAEKKRLVDTHGIEHFLPSREQVARDVYNLASNERIEARDREKFYRLYSEIQGYIGKPGQTSVSITNENRPTNIVIMGRPSRYANE